MYTCETTLARIPTVVGELSPVDPLQVTFGLFTIPPLALLIGLRFCLHSGCWRIYFHGAP